MCNDGQTKLLPTKLGVGNRTLANKFFYLCSFMKQRIYIDTSVLGGYFDKEFETDTKLFFKRILNQEYLVHLSPISQIELLPAPQRVKDLVQDIPQIFLRKHGNLQTIISAKEFWAKQALMMLIISPLLP